MRFLDKTEVTSSEVEFYFILFFFGNRASLDLNVTENGWKTWMHAGISLQLRYNSSLPCWEVK